MHKHDTQTTRKAHTQHTQNKYRKHTQQEHVKIFFKKNLTRNIRKTHTTGSLKK